MRTEEEKNAQAINNLWAFRKSQKHQPLRSPQMNSSIIIIIIAIVVGFRWKANAPANSSENSFQ